MKPIVRLAVGVSVVAVLGVLAWREVRKDETTGKMRTAELVFPYPTGRVADFTVKSGDTDASFHRGAGGEWERLRGPEKTDLARVGDFLAAWGRVRFFEVIDDNPPAADLKKYGLDPPVMVLKAKLRAPREGEVAPGQDPQLELGLAAPLQPAFYARVSGFPRVVLVGAEAADLKDGIGLELFGEASKIEKDERSPGVPARH